MKIVFKILDYIEETLIVILLAFMTIMNFVNVVSRYLLANSFSFTEELTVMAFVWASMLGIATGYKKYSHLGMSFVVDQFPPKGQAVFVLLSMVCSLATMCFMVYLGFEMVSNQIMLKSMTPALRLPSAMQGLAMPVGGLFIAVRSLQAGILEFLRLWRGQKPKAGEEQVIC